jgi:hypothetical protein
MTDRVSVTFCSSSSAARAVRRGAALAELGRVNEGSQLHLHADVASAMTTGAHSNPTWIGFRFADMANPLQAGVAADPSLSSTFSCQ